MAIRPRPLILMILDGWGYREDLNDNAIAAAKKPCWDALWHHYPHTLISGSGRCVGLPEGQMGNSEVGHLNMGSGRIIYQDLTRIDRAIETHTFDSNPAFTRVFSQAKQENKAVHLIGLLSPGGVHSHENHLFALLKIAATYELSEVYIHAFLDGRDTPPRSAAASLKKLIDYCHQLGCGKVVSMIGRYYAMDRDNRWERVQKAYDLLTLGKADYISPDPLSGLASAYERHENDEFVSATSIHDPHQLPVTIQDNDSIIFTNFRSDRARELTRALIEPSFKEFSRQAWPSLQEFVTFTEYDPTFPVTVAFPPERLARILGEYLSELNLSQLRIAETEKYAHVTFFFNGGIEKPYPGEERLLIPSPKVATYDLQPEMSAYTLTAQLTAKIREKKYDVIICNFANPDMVGHTGNFAATIKAIETIDVCLQQIIEALKEVGGEALITADHGNAEMMFDRHTGQAHTAHTHELVPFIYIGRTATIAKSEGVLSDIAPTMLYLMGLPQPAEMTGESLLTLS